MTDKRAEMLSLIKKANDLKIYSLSDDELNQWIETIRPYIPTQKVGPDYNQVVYYIRPGDTDDATIKELVRIFDNLCNEQDHRQEFSADTFFSEAENLANKTLADEGYDAEGYVYYSPRQQKWNRIRKDWAEAIRNRHKNETLSQKNKSEMADFIARLNSRPWRNNRSTINYGMDNAPIGSPIHCASNLLHLIDFTRQGLWLQTHDEEAAPEQSILHDAKATFEIGQLFAELKFLTRAHDFAEKGYRTVRRGARAGKAGAQRSLEAKNRRMTALIEAYEIIAKENPIMKGKKPEEYIDDALEKAQEIDPEAFSGGQGVTAKAGADYVRDISSAKQKDKFTHDLKLRLKGIFPNWQQNRLSGDPKNS